MTLAVGVVKVAEDSDFRRFKEMCEDTDGWNLATNKRNIMVWTKTNDLSNFNMMKMKADFEGVPASVMYDVLHDPDYRKVWDRAMIEGSEICAINPNNDIGYYAVKCPAPLKNRDFVTQRSWLAIGEDEYIIFNHSVSHAKRPLKKGIIRGVSFLTGYLVRSIDAKSCQMTYVSQCDPKGNLPAWIINKMTKIMAPKVMSRLYKAAKNYNAWKSKNQPKFKPWLYPEQMMTSLPQFNPADIEEFNLSASSESLEESGEMKEEDFQDDDDDL